MGAGYVPDPIFIVGLPRAGSTLLEQILASQRHRRTLELPHVVALASACGAVPSPRGSPSPRS